MRWPTRSWLGGLVVVPMVALLPSGADAQAVATTFAGLQTLITREEYVVVIDRTDRETWGRVAALSASELTLVTVESTNGGALRVERQGVDDPSGNGAVIGALIGAGTGLALVASMYAACDAGCDAPEPGGMYSMAAGFGAGIGALAGWVIDELHKGRETVYPVVSPVLTSRHKGGVLSVKF